MSDGHSIIICDAGPILHLDELGRLSLLNDFDRVYIPKQVWEEVNVHRPDALSAVSDRFHQVDVPLLYESAFHSISKSFSLDLGEQAALTLMQKHPEAIFLTAVPTAKSPPTSSSPWALSKSTSATSSANCKPATAPKPSPAPAN